MKHIRLYLIALFVACSMFMVCPFAYADSMNESYKDIILSDMQSYCNGYNYIDYNTIFNTCPYCTIFTCTINGVLYRFYDFFPYEDMCYNSFDGSTFDISYMSSSGKYIRFNSNRNISTNLSCYRLVSYNNSSLLRAWRYTFTSSSLSTTAYSGYYASTNGSTLYNGGNVPSSNNVSSFNAIQSYSNLYLNVGRNTFNLLQDTFSPIVYTEDERLKLYKLWSSQNGDSLVVDLSAFRSYTPAAAYDFSNILLTLTTNGVDTDYNLPLSSSTINNGWDSNSNLYTISTPVSSFTLSDTYDTYITKVSFSLDVSSPGGSGSTPYYINANFPLDVHHSSITPGAVPTPVYINPTVKTPQDLSSLVSDMSLKSTHNINGTFVVHSSYTLPEWADSYIFELNRYSDNSDSNYAGRYIDGNPNDTNTRYVNFDDVVYPIIETFDNSYDVFVFPIHSWYAGSSIPSSIDDLGITGYLIFYTDRYFQRQETLSDVDILTVLQTDANNFVDFVEYIQVRLDDFENKSLEILNPLYDETTYIDDKLASILYAVNSIENYNDSSIVTLLTDIKNLLSSPENEIDTPQECIQLYEAHPDYFNELWGTPTPSLRSASVTPSANNPYISSDYVRADLIPAWWEGKTLTMIYILKNDGESSRFYNDILNGLFDSYENLIESDNSFNTYIDSLFKTGYDYTSSFYGHLFDLDYNPEAWDGGFTLNE